MPDTSNIFHIFLFALDGEMANTIPVRYANSLRSDHKQYFEILLAL